MVFLFLKSLAFLQVAALSLQWAGFSWTVPNPADWQVVAPGVRRAPDRDEGAPAVLRLLTGREPLSNLPRRPFQFALADAGPYRSVRLEVDARPQQRSLMLVFAYQDPAHFDYAHLSIDTGTKQPMHNGIFHVFGGERVRISDLAGPPAFQASQRWYHVTLHWDGATGAVDVTVDGVPVPALRAVDLSLKQGKVGLGSFDETADFRNLQLHAS